MSPRARERPRPPGPGVALLLLVLLLLRLGAFWPTTVEVTTDSQAYLEEPVSLTGQGNRSVLGGLLFQALQGHLLTAAALQHLLSTAAWLFAAAVAVLVLGRAAGVLVFLLSFASCVAAWEDNILLESLLLSGVVTWLGLLVRELDPQRPASTLLRTVSWALVTLGLYLLKPAYFPFWLLMLALQLVLAWRRAPAWAVPGLLLFAVVLVAELHLVQPRARSLSAWQAQTRSYSLQRHPEYRALEVAARAPPCPSFDAAARARDQGPGWTEAWQRLSSRCPERKAWYEAGGLGLARWALDSPLLAAELALRDLHLGLISPFDYLAPRRDFPLSRLVDATVFAPSLRARLYPSQLTREDERQALLRGFAWLLALGGGLLALRIAGAPGGTRWTLHAEALFALLAFGACCLLAIGASWAADGMDLERHALVWNVPLKLLLLLAPPLCLKRRAGPDAA